MRAKNIILLKTRTFRLGSLFPLFAPAVAFRAVLSLSLSLFIWPSSNPSMHFYIRLDIPYIVGYEWVSAYCDISLYLENSSSTWHIVYQ